MSIILFILILIYKGIHSDDSDYEQETSLDTLS